jgi:5S rRNA maturation endonuclease (ribonuclease M5)
VNHSKKEVNTKKLLEELLFSLKSSFVVVEGKHDVKTLSKIGIESHTYESVMRSKTTPSEDVILFFDKDRRGKEKEEYLSYFLKSQNVKVDSITGKYLLNILKTVHVEGILSPIERLIKT